MKQMEIEAFYHIIQANGERPHNNAMGQMKLKISVEWSELRKFP